MASIYAGDAASARATLRADGTVTQVRRSAVTTRNPTTGAVVSTTAARTQDVYAIGLAGSSGSARTAGGASSQEFKGGSFVKQSNLKFYFTTVSPTPAFLPTEGDELLWIGEWIALRSVSILNPDGQVNILWEADGTV